MTKIIPMPSIPVLMRDNDKAVQETFPSYYARRSAITHSEENQTAWLLPGASARNNKPGVPARVKAAISSALKKTSNRKIQHVQSRGIRRRNSNQPYDRNNAARNAVAVPGAAQGNHRGGDQGAKESMTSQGTYSSYLGKRNGMAEIERQEEEKKNSAQESSTSTEIIHSLTTNPCCDRKREKGIFHLPQTLIVKDDRVNDKASRLNQDKSIHCLRFINVQEIEAYVKESRFNKRNNYVCLGSELWGLFDTLFHNPRYSDNGFKPEQVISYVIKHTTLNKTRLVDVKEHENLASAWLGPGYIKSMLTGSLASVLTLSVTDDTVLRQRRIESKFILPENTFKLFKSPGPLETSGYFLSYHVNRCRDNQGFNAGILPLSIENEWLVVEDDAAGISFKGDSINTFIDGVKKISGLDYHYTAPLRRTKGELTVREHELLNTQSLFINKNTTQKAFCQGNNINEALSFFSPVVVNHTGADRQYRLYRTCFTLVENSLLYVNQQGEQGEFRLENITKKSQRYHVLPQSASDARFYNLLGFIHQQPYSKEALITQLEQKGFHYLVMENATNVELLLRNDGFYVDYTEEMSDEIEGNTTSAPAEVERETEITTGLYRCFFLRENELHYYDQEGEYGILSFTLSDRLPLMILDADKMLPKHRIFSASITLIPDLAYNKTEIYTQLLKSGYVNFPNMPTPSAV